MGSSQFRLLLERRRIKPRINSANAQNEATLLTSLLLVERNNAARPFVGSRHCPTGRIRINGAFDLVGGHRIDVARASGRDGISQWRKRIGRPRRNREFAHLGRRADHQVVCVGGGDHSGARGTAATRGARACVESCYGSDSAPLGKICCDAADTRTISGGNGGWPAGMVQAVPNLNRRAGAG